MFHSLSICILSFASLSIAQNALSLSPTAKAAGAPVSEPLDASFAGFGIEPSNLFSFTGESKTNQFSVQLLQNLADYSGAPPHIRLGGNTGDYMIYDSSFNDYRVEGNARSVGQGVIASDSLRFGPSYFKALDRFPKDTPVTYGLNLAYMESDYIKNIVGEAKAAVDGMKNVKLYSFEIGNEPDLYLQNQMRSGSWSGEVFTRQFLERAEAVYDQVLRPAGLPALFFEAPATASTIGTTFEIDQLIEDGLTNAVNGSNFISAWNQHDYFYFIGVSTVPMTLNDLMNLDNTNAQFKYWETQVKAGLGAGLPYVLREMSSVGPIGMHDVSDTFGAALWTLNFLLYTASLNISSVQMHMTDNSNASAWQPVNMYGKDPFVRPQYYAHVAMAQIIGNGNGTTQIGVLDTDDVPSSYKGRIRAFTAYANGNLQAVVLINSRQANASSTNKDSFTFDLDLGSENRDKEVFLSYLTTDGADSLSGTTWNGMSFSDDDGKTKVVNDTVTSLRTSSSGSISIPVRDSQAVVANLGWLLGSNKVLVGDSSRPSKTGKKSEVSPTKTQGANTAILTGVVTTTFALASSITAGAEETGAARQTGEAKGRGAGMRSLVIGTTMALVVGYAYIAW
ncbi:glycoside hydrolase family 79 protein [Zopfia rhizophila CBS 207.26]|uniref:Glycoside hydrolase family 79 protein n=1 Tax=Zopfia rhizophila CBS 207.26 TaxID=1314779 RepID=A0A6A6ECP8_9PEZI|nr:glycoside hydrolase family 79 protein [Zopfia rhizophila CBS 207.26]